MISLYLTANDDALICTFTGRNIVIVTFVLIFVIVTNKLIQGPIHCETWNKYEYSLPGECLKKVEKRWVDITKNHLGFFTKIVKYLKVKRMSES